MDREPLRRGLTALLHRRYTVLAALALAAALPAGATRADEPTIVEVAATRTGEAFRFDVTVRHDDEGWDHYANAFVVTLPDGTVLGTRILAHPHVNEQPFTRSLGGVTVPNGVSAVHVHAVDKVHGAGPAITVELN